MQKNSSTKTALITGAGKRLGAAIAKALLQDGFDLLLHYHTSSKGAEQIQTFAKSLGRKVSLVSADLRVPDSSKVLAKTAQNTFGRLDVLINNAGGFEKKPLKEISDQDWSFMLDLNVTAPFRIIRETASLLRDSNGLIINLACVTSKQPWPEFSHYATSKAALWMLTQCLALELAPEVRVNAIAPGTVLPPTSYGTERLESLRQSIPLARFGSAESIVKAVRYLIDADFVTGVLLPVDGGRGLQTISGHD